MCGSGFGGLADEKGATVYEPERNRLAGWMRRLCRQRLTTTSGGNLSRRLDGDRVLLTASRFDKGRLRGTQVGVLSMTGENLTPHLTPSIEASLHLALYRQHPEVDAIVHAHPPLAGAFCAARTRINCRLTAEAYAIIGEPVTVGYAPMGSARLAALVADGIGDARCLLMTNHGVVTVGANLLQAFERLEVLEAAARMTLITQRLDGVSELTPEQTAELDVLMDLEL